MTHPAQPIDVAAVVDALHARIAQQTPAGATHADASAELYDVHEALHEMELTRVISAHLPIVNTTIVGRMLGLAQKITRRLLRWYINPIVEQQNMYNDAVMRTIREIVAAYEQNPPVVAPTVPPTLPPHIAATDAAQVQAQVARTESPLSPHTLALLQLAALRAQHQHVHTHWPLPTRVPLDHVANAVHKLQRRGLRWYIDPIVAQMNAHNLATQRTLQRLEQYITATRCR